LGRRLGGKDLYDCSKCEENPGLKRLLGHDGPPEGIFREHLLSGEPLKECPMRTLLRAHDESPAALQELNRYSDLYHPAYDDGHLLVSGGLADQPARYLDLIMALRISENQMQQKYDEVDAKNQEAD
jgi:hypothetical protein